VGENMPRLLASIYDRFMRETEKASLHEWRTDLLSHANGDVLEVGAGTGINLELYSKAPKISSLTLAEPDPHMRKRLEARIREAARHDVKVIDATVENLPFANASFDTVVATLLLCSVRDQAVALASIRRVLRPSGRYLFLEHVAADENPGRLVWQKRIEPFWKIVGDNCHLTRQTLKSIESAGFSAEIVTRASMRKALPFLRPTIRGVAT
jgi:ubiquinone/menaquinone biosynthesis C-methylase UbiE